MGFYVILVMMLFLGVGSFGWADFEDKFLKDESQASKASLNRTFLIISAIIGLFTSLSTWVYFSVIQKVDNYGIIFYYGLTLFVFHVVTGVFLRIIPSRHMRYISDAILVALAFTVIYWFILGYFEVGYN